MKKSFVGHSTLGHAAFFTLAMQIKEIKALRSPAAKITCLNVFDPEFPGLIYAQNPFPGDPYLHPTHLGQWWTGLLLIEVILLRLLLKEAEAKHH